MSMFAGVNNILDDVAPSGGPTTISGFIFIAINALVGIGVSLGFISLTYAFIQYTTSGGDPKKLKKAQDSALWAGIAIFVSVLAWTLKRVVYTWVGVEQDLPDGL